MNILNNISQTSRKDDAAFLQILFDSTQEHMRISNTFWKINIAQISKYRDEVSTWNDDQKIAFLLFCGQKLATPESLRMTDEETFQMHLKAITRAYFQKLLLAKIVFSTENIKDIIDVLFKIAKNTQNIIAESDANAILKQIEQLPIERIDKKILIPALEQLNRAAEINKKYDRTAFQKIKDRCEYLSSKILNPEQFPVSLFSDGDPFATYANDMILSEAPVLRQYWFQLISLAKSNTGTKPSQKYLANAAELIQKIGISRFSEVVNLWWQFIIDLKESITEVQNRWFDYTTCTFLQAENHETIKGMVWACVHLNEKSTLENIGNLAQRCYRKIPVHGAPAIAIGNACLFTLAQSNHQEGFAQLSRLKVRIKYSVVLKLIEKYLLEAALKKGITADEVEDLAVPHLGFIDSQLSTKIGTFIAEAAISPEGKIELKWRKTDGTVQNSLPASLKNEYADEIRALKSILKQADLALSVQRERFDSFFRKERKWSAEKLQAHYFNHGLLSTLAQKLIWNFNTPEGTKSGMYWQGNWITYTGENIHIPETTDVYLWHPVSASLDEIRHWREFLLRHEIRQPVKQAFREVYLLTPAEINTGLYSNRMAAHILRQHQFNALAKARGWKYGLKGAFDSGNLPAEIVLKEYGLRAEFWVNDVETFHPTPSGIWEYISTDQIRFSSLRTKTPIPLNEIPPILFSEVMRDADMFVGVASIGNDPEWIDSGETPEQRSYWNSYAFGNLGETAKNRKAILELLIGRLKIRDVVTIADKFLVVKGKIRTYKIHLGSSNILMSPNDQYLCIVEDQTSKITARQIFIPFEGDRTLSLILSKAFLLAEDDKIKDPTIIRQLRTNL